MTLPKFIKRSDEYQMEQKRGDDNISTQAPVVKHVDLLMDRDFLKPVEDTDEVNPQTLNGDGHTKPAPFKGGDEELEPK